MGFIVLDWWYFGRPESEAVRYGYRVGSMAMELTAGQTDTLPTAFGPSGVLPLPHGAALWFADRRRLLLKPDCRRFAARFRTAWPLKGAVEVRADGTRVTLVCAKRTPWSSALVTFVWFLLVAGGTIGFCVSFAMQGGLASMGGMMLGFGVVALGLLVLIFGMVTVALAYRIENGRLEQVWKELQEAVAGADSPVAG